MSSNETVKPVFGPPMSKEIFGNIWCIKFRDLHVTSIAQGPDNFANAIRSIKEYVGVFMAQAAALKLDSENYGDDINYTMIHVGGTVLLPWHKDFRFTNPFCAAMYMIRWGQRMEAAIKSGQRFADSTTPEQDTLTPRDVFAHKWCNKFTALIKDLTTCDRERREEIVQSITQQAADFEDEAEARGFRENDFAIDSTLASIIERRGFPIPTDPGFRYSNPFFAARMVLKTAEQVTERSGL